MKQQRIKLLIANKNELIVTVRHSPYNLSLEEQNEMNGEVKKLVKLLKDEGCQYFFKQLALEVNKVNTNQ